MNQLTSIQTFIIFCLEAYKNENNISGNDVLKEFKRYDVFSFLESGFDVLHTQSKKYIIDEITAYIKQRK